MDVSGPFEGLFPTVDSAVLTVLSRTERAFSGREVARRSNRSHTGVQKVLDRLVEHGLIVQQRGGGSLLYSLNREHVAASAVQELAGLRASLFDRLRETIEDWEVPPVHASVFGSAARGDGNTESDIDLLVVRPKDRDRADAVWTTQIDSLSEAVPAWTGNPIGLVEISVRDIPRLRRERPSVVKDVMRQGVSLAGTPARRLFAGGDES